MAKFTFKKHPRAQGLRAIAYSKPDVDIKLNGKCVGLIKAPTAFGDENQYIIQFMVVGGNNKPGWSWTRLKRRCDTEAEAREFINKHAQAIQFKYQLFQLDN